jgi:CRP-like cAMP-binding protein
MNTTTELRKLRPFAGCTRREVRRIEGLATRTTLRAGHVICEQGAVGEECVVLCSGSAVIERDGAIVATAARGDVVGEIALLDETRRYRTATVLTMTDCDVMVFSRQEFRRLGDEFPSADASIRLAGIRRLAQLVHDDPGSKEPVSV